MIKRRRFPKLFPGWWVVVAGAFLNLWGGGYHAYGFSALFNPIAKELSLSRAVTSVASSIDRVGGGIQAPLLGWITDRFGPRRVILFGVFLFGLALILMYFVNSLWTFYLVWGILLGTGNNAATGVAVSTAITNWFVKKRGLALGVRMMISAVFLLPLVTWLITTQGWRTACVVGGVVMLVVGVPLVWFFVRQHRPEYYGLLPDGATLQEEAGGESKMIDRGVRYAAEIQEVEFTLRQAMRTPAYWLLIVAHIGPNLAAGALMVHLIPLLTDMGLSPTRAAAAMTLAGFASPLTRFGSGLFADRLKKERLRLLLGGTYLLEAIGIIVFVLNQTIAMAYPFLVLYFVCLAVNFIVSPVLVGRYFGRKAFGSIQGTSAIMTMPFGILAPVYLGWVYDTTDSYASALLVIAALLTLSAFLMFLARPPKPPAQIGDIRRIL